MRQYYNAQRRFDCTPIAELMLNWDCRDEMIPILAGLQHVYNNGELRRKVVKLVADEINDDSRHDIGRPGLDDWQIVVISAVRLGCNYDYDKLQDQAENHRSLRVLLGLGDWDEGPSFQMRTAIGRMSFAVWLRLWSAPTWRRQHGRHWKPPVWFSRPAQPIPGGAFWLGPSRLALDVTGYTKAMTCHRTPKRPAYTPIPGGVLY